MIDRRTFLASAAGALAAGCGRSAPEEPAKRQPSLAPRFEAVRATLGPRARLGVAAIDLGSGRTVTFDADSRYAMASTFKLPLAAFALHEAERGRVGLEEELAFAAGDPLPNSPVVEGHLRRGKLPVERLAAAIVERSDNSAANLLLRRLGGPAALTRFLRACGDPVTRLDRYEMELNSNLPGDPRDTTSPAAMARLTARLVEGRLLTGASRARLSAWLRQATPGPDRLPAGLPRDWVVGHKTGTGANGATNDVAVAWPPGRPALVIACYQSGGDAALPKRAAAHAAVARLATEHLG